MAFNPQTVKFVGELRSQLPGYITNTNMFSDQIRNMKAMAIDGANAPTQEDIDEINRIGQQMWGNNGYVPLTLEAWNELLYAMTAIYDGWNGGQNGAFLDAKP